MAAGYTVPGRGDLDALFMARVNTARAAVGYLVAGTDIANRYETIGAGTPIAATGFKSAGTDLASLFRNISEPLGGGVSLANMFCDAATSGVAAVATYSLRSSGDIFATQGTNTVADAGDWLAPKSGMSGYECRATIVSGTLQSGTTGTWLALSADRTWTRNQVAVGSQSCVFDIEIRNATTLAVLDTARIELFASRS